MNPYQPRRNGRSTLRGLLLGICVFGGLFASYRFFSFLYRPYQMMEAAKRGDLAVVEQLLAHGTNVDAVDGWGATALMYAAQKGHVRVVKALLDAGANIDTHDAWHSTALMYAAGWGPPTD